MIITNKLRLPQQLVNMAKRDYKFEPNEYRVTQLLKGIRETILERRHYHEIEQDVSDMIWLLFGTAVHSIIEHHKEADHEFKEERIKIRIGNYILSGKFDLYNAETKTITDYKTCSIWKVVNGDYEDWRRQLLIYAYMLQSIGFPVEKAEIIALMKDHSKAQAKRKADYP
ncbi:MAG TPA: PD-(D/E)XK nuclease family protein, partial [Fervidobacterium sp.]|nr:PD-(D/E)XK nuclease family protein [Fervidobacterium sp.]